MLVHLVLFVLINAVNNAWLKLLIFSLLAILSVEGLRGFVFTTKRIIHINKEEYSWHHDLQFQRYADGILRAHMKKMNSLNAVVAGSSYYMNHRIALYSNIPVMYDASGLNQMATLTSSRTTSLLVVLHRNQLQQYKNFLAEQSAQLAGQFDEFFFVHRLCFQRMIPERFFKI